jgi:hypothetical protein
LAHQIHFVAYKNGYTLPHPGAFKTDGWNKIAARRKWEFARGEFHQI